jgi:hypothetical protein
MPNGTRTKTKRTPITHRVCIFGKPGGARRYCQTEVHQQQYGNHNYVLVDVLLDRTTGKPTGQKRIGEGGPVYTVFTKDAHCGRGEYAEGLDIELSQHYRRRGEAATVRRIAEAVLAAEYEPGLRVTRIVERFGMF